MALVLYRPLFWFLILLITGLLIWIARLRGLRWWPALITRLILVGSALLGIFSPKGEFISQVIPAREVMVIDLSDSIDPFLHNEIQARAREWQEQKPGRIIICFGAQPMVAITPRGDCSNVDGRSSDLISAIKMAKDILGDVPGRIILASDGRQNNDEDQLSKMVQEVERIGHRLDIFPLKGRVSKGDVFLGPISVPTSLWENTEFEVVFPIYNPPADAQTMSLKLIVNEQPVDSEAQLLFDNLYSFKIPPQVEGITTIEIIAESQGDPFILNNVSTAVVQIFASPRILFVSLTFDSESDFIKSLREFGLSVDVILPDKIPTDIQVLDAYKVIFIHNLLASNLGLDKMLALQVYVSKMGGGLIFLGGRNSYTLGDYKNTILEPMLPVKLEPPQRPDRPPILFLLVLDRSASMQEGREAEIPINLAREAAMRAVENLRPEDYLGLLTYETNTNWDIPLRALGDGLSLRQALDAIGTIVTSGGTRIFNALNMALDSIKELPASGPESKHILLLSDGQSYDGTLEEFQTIAEEARQFGVVISTIALGAKADQETMSLIASSAKGRYYPALEAGDLPKIMLAESEAVRSENVQYGQTTLIFGEAEHPILSGISTSRLPSLTAYNALSSKSTEGAEDVLVSSSYGDPILAVWQYGLGRVVAWMADVGEEWSLPWRVNSDEGSFWSQVVRYALPNPIIGPAQVEVVTQDTGVIVNAFIQDLYQNPVNLAKTHFTFVDKNRKGHQYQLQQIAPGKYSVEIERPPIGAYRGIFSYEAENIDKKIVPVPFAVGAPVEWLSLDTKEELSKLIDQVQEVGGREISQSDLIKADDATAQVEPIFVVDWLAYILIGLVLFWPLEIALRRRWQPWR